MSALASASDSSQSSSGYEDGLGRRVLAFDRESGTILERLVLRPELCAFEKALKERLSIVADLEDERFAKPRTIEHLVNGTLIVISEFVGGRRLSDIIDAAAEHGIVAGLDAGLGLLLELLPAIARLHDAGLAHGAIAGGRIMITPAGQILLLDAIYAEPLERLQLTRKRLWSELRLAFPPNSGRVHFDKPADLAHAVLVAASLIVGRSLRDEEYPDGIGSLRQEILEIASIRGTNGFADSVDTFFASLLPLAGKNPAISADEAAIDLRKLVRKELGVNTCRTALTEFLQQVETADAERLTKETGRRDGRTKQESERASQARAESERLALEKAEAERIAREREEEEAERKAREQAEREAREKSEAEFKAREKAEAERKAREEAERKAREEAERKAREEAERKAREKAEAERKAREEAERKAREEAERKAREEAERKAREEAERKAREEAERKAREKAEAERKAREEAERKAREKADAERKAREEAERKAREKADAERKAREEAERRAREAAERKAREKAEAESRERDEAERKAQEEDERRARERAEAERKAREKAEAERKAREEEDERNAREETERQAREWTERKARERREAERVAREKADAEQRQHERAEREQLERERLEGERQAREEALRKERLERERRDAEAAAAEKAARASEPAASEPSDNWLVKPEHAAAFQKLVPDAAEHTTPPPSAKPYPIYVAPAEPAVWAPDAQAKPAPAIEITSFASPSIRSTDPAVTPVPSTLKLKDAGIIKLKESGAIKLKDTASGVEAPARADLRNEPGESSAAEAYAPGFSIFSKPEQRLPWKLIAAGAAVIALAVGVMELFTPGAPVIATVKKVVPDDAAPKEPARVPTPGEIVVNTDPAGLKVLLDGRTMGESPITLKKVLPGRHVVTLIGDGGTLKRVIRVEPGGGATIDVPVFSGFLKVSAPFVIEIAEGGKVIGTSDDAVIIGPGRHKLYLSNKDLDYAETRDVDVQPGETTQLSLDPHGQTNINAAPWAEVWIDGQKIGETPLANVSIRLGVREIVFKNPQFPDRKVVATIKGGAADTIAVDFNKDK